MTEKWKSLITERIESQSVLKIITDAIQQHLQYDTSLTPRKDIDNAFDIQRIEALIEKAHRYYEFHADLLNNTHNGDTTIISNIVRAHLVNFEPDILTFNIEQYEIWKTNLLQSKNKICVFYKHVDQWLQATNQKPKNPEDLADLIHQYDLYVVSDNTHSLEEWIQNKCEIPLDSEYTSSIWKSLKFKIEDCADYNFFS